MKRSPQKFRKNDSYKSRPDLLPVNALEFVSHVLRHGEIKYPAPRFEQNWSKCKDPSRYVAAMLRHIFQHMKSGFTDHDTGLPSLAHALASGLFALELYLKGAQDRYVMGSYFALIFKKSKTRGLVLKRFTKFEKAWKYLESNNLDPEKHLIKTLPYAIKTGSTTKL